MKSLFDKAKPFIGVVFLQAGLAGMDIISKAALNEGMSNFVYRHAVATLIIAPFAFLLDKKVRPKMTVSTFLKILLMSLLEPVIDQNLYFLGMKYTTATFAAAMANVLPAITFVMAWCFRLEKVKMMSIRSQAKIIGTIATIAGAMIMTLVTGPNLDLPWTRGGPTAGGPAHPQVSLQYSIKGALFITLGCFSWAAFMILQGIFCSGIAYYVQGVVMKERGPVFVTAFSPLSMVIVAILSSFILAERMYLGRVVGAVVIVMGLYFVVWGKQKDYETPSIEEIKEIPVKMQAQNTSDDVSKAEVVSNGPSVVESGERLV